MEEGKKKGSVIKFGDNINTDIISPPQYMEYDIQESSKYAMSAVCPDFADQVKSHTIMVAGENFGSGSSRETSPLSLKYLGVEVIVAKYFARIFYRNAINIGLLVVECESIDAIQSEDILEIDYKAGIIRNITRAEEYVCTKIPQHLVDLIEAGGLVATLKKELSV